MNYRARIAKLDLPTFADEKPFVAPRGPVFFACISTSGVVQVNSLGDDAANVFQIERGRVAGAAPGSHPCQEAGMQPTFRGPLFGVVPILLTPFHENGSIDEPSLRNEVDWTIDGGAHGLGIALGSEIFKLTEAERDQVISIVIDQAQDRVPVVVNTGAVATDLAVFYSKRAHELGAVAVMVTPPGPGFSAAAVIGYFQAISDAVPLPIVLQDTSTTPIPAALIRTIGEQVEWATYAKVESLPPADQVHRAVDIAGDVVEVFGGAGGGQFIPELRRGAIGTMPFPTTIHAFRQVWDRWHAGDIDGAKALFAERIRPLLDISIGSLGGAHIVHKEALKAQGVIASAHVRGPIEPLDPMTREDLFETFAGLGWTAS